MKDETTPVTMARVYLTQSSANLDTLLRKLRDWGRLRGVTVFHGAHGYGEHVALARQGDLPADDAPVVIEFFDHADRVAEAIAVLSDVARPQHVVTWPATVHSAGKAPPPQ